MDRTVGYKGSQVNEPYSDNGIIVRMQSLKWLTLIQTFKVETFASTLESSVVNQYSELFIHFCCLLSKAVAACGLILAFWIILLSYSLFTAHCFYHATDVWVMLIITMCQWLYFQLGAISLVLASSCLTTLERITANNCSVRKICNALIRICIYIINFATCTRFPHFLPGYTAKIYYATPTVRVPFMVTQGQPIATHQSLHCGCYKNTMIDHIHVEISRGGTTIDPTLYLFCSTSTVQLVWCLLP